MHRLVATASRWFAVLLIGLPAAGHMDARAAEPEAEPPPARVGQLAFISGTVRLWGDPALGWQPAVLNMPITAAHALATDLASRLELRVGSTALRAGVQAQFSLTELDDKAVTADLARGSLAVRVRALPVGERLAITAEGVRFSALTPGAYRADFAPRLHRLTVHVLEGQAQLSLPPQDLVLGANQRVVVDTRSLTVMEQGASDDRSRLDDFSDQRDRRSERSNALRYLPPEMTGAESLDGQGAWRSEPGYGAVWFPDKLPPDWAPYRFGRWTWLAPWGWTWLDDAPWGFAPFHYGRWLFAGGRWGWVPGTPAARAAGWRPVFAPALVGFYGGQAGGWAPAPGAAPAVGWYPLAPGEVYWPGYSTHLGYVRTLNAAHVNDASQIRGLPDPGATGPAHRFARTAFAATAVPASGFHGMEAVGPQQLGLSPAALAQAPLSGRRAPPERTAAERAAPEPAAAGPAGHAKAEEPRAQRLAAPRRAGAGKPLRAPKPHGAKGKG
jgi:hypothetical protein